MKHWWMYSVLAYFIWNWFGGECKEANFCSRITPMRAISWSHECIIKPCEKAQMLLNSSPSSAAYMRQWTASVLLQAMACRLFGAKPLPNDDFLPIAPLGTNFSEVRIKIQNFSFMKMSEKWRTFCSGGDELRYTEHCSVLDIHGPWNWPTGFGRIRFASQFAQWYLEIPFLCPGLSWQIFNSSPHGQNGRHFADDIFICILWINGYVFWWWWLKFHWSFFLRV